MDEIITANDNDYVIAKQYEEALVNLDHAIEDLKKKQNEIKKALLEEMEIKGIIKVDTDRLTINFVDGYDRETLDSKKLKQELPTIYDEYIKITAVKPSVRIKVK